MLTPGSVRPPTLTVAAFAGDRLLMRTLAEGESGASEREFTVTPGGDATAGGEAWCMVEFG